MKIGSRCLLLHVFGNSGPQSMLCALSHDALMRDALVIHLSIVLRVGLGAVMYHREYVVMVPYVVPHPAATQ
jgi:hypothetical protein